MGMRFGVDYYPEHWARERWRPDLQRMKAMGFSIVRVMEFAWTLLEPEPGRYDFTLFDAFIAEAQLQGLQVIVGTPTATFPAWLYEKHPDIMQIHPDGSQEDYGTRRQACLNAPGYLEAAYRIVRAVGEHFSGAPAVMGWQIDNEIGHEGSHRCICPHCQAAWHEWLKERYGTIGALNNAWGTVFWGTTYTKFEQVPVPRQQLGSPQSPSLCLDYDRFSSDTAVRFVATQAAILHEWTRPEQSITTNLYPTPHYPVIDMEKLFAPLDRAAYDNYPVWGDQDEPMPYYFTAYILSYIRGLKGNHPFTIMEQFSDIQGHVCLGYLPAPEQVVLWTNQAIARGADTIVYFRWRAVPFGQEQLCYGLHHADDCPTRAAELLAENVRRNQSVFAGFASELMTAKACLVYDKDNARLLKEQYLSKGLYLKPAPYMQVGYDIEMARAFCPFVLFNVNADVMSAASVELERYKVVTLPLYVMADPVFVQRLDAWVRNGGHLILGWRAGARDQGNFATTDLLPGPFAEMAGIRVRAFESLNQTKTKIRVGKIPAKGEVWVDLIEPTTAHPIGFYTDRRKHYRGTPCFTVNRHGQGLVYYLGTSPDPIAIFFLYRKILKRAGLNPNFYGMGVEAVERVTSDGKPVKIIMNHTGKTKHAKGLKLKPYETRIVVKK